MRWSRHHPSLLGGFPPGRAVLQCGGSPGLVKAATSADGMGPIDLLCRLLRYDDTAMQVATGASNTPSTLAGPLASDRGVAVVQRGGTRAVVSLRRQRVSQDSRAAVG